MGAIRKIKRKRGAKFEATLQIDGRQVRKRFETYEEADAWSDERKAEIREGRVGTVTDKPLGVVVDRYLEFKAVKGKRSLRRGEEILRKRIVPFFGASTSLAKITAQRIAEYERAQAAAVFKQLKRPVSPSTINRHLAILRHLLTLAHEWGYVRVVPRIRLSREPEGRKRFLDRDEASRLLDVCHLSELVPARDRDAGA